jgi:hypothetical protein
MDDSERAVRLLPRFLIGGTAVIYLIVLSVREFNPIAGTWEPVSAQMNGQSLMDIERWRLWLEIDTNGNGKVATYWVCGVKHTSFVEGQVRVFGDHIDFHDHNVWTGVVSAYPRNRAERLPNGHLTMRLPLEGGTATVEFVRRSNGSTLLDYLGWR